MDPREFWDRNTVLAEAFCASDERVRQAQSVLDETQAERSRTLAAFAVTVGNDGTVADLMGLHEREVRVARRTVGRDDARSVAEKLLARAPQAQSELLADHQPAMEFQLPGQRGESVPPPVDTYDPTVPLMMPMTAPMPMAPPQVPQAPMAPPLPTAPAADETVVWSSNMDSVLLWSWKSGIELQTVATELGLDLRALLLRVQVLAADGLLPLTPASDNAGQAGRHRRHHDDPYAFVGPSTTSFATPLYR